MESVPTEAVIMAAGKSTRTYPLTATRPKPLVPIWGRPLLGHQIRQLRGIVGEVIVVVGFLRDQIQATFGSEHEGVRLRYVTQERQRGTADALLAARPFVSSRVLVLNGDDFYHREDLLGLARTGRGLLVTRASDPQNRAVVRIESERITGIEEKPASPAPGSWCSIGGYCLEKEDLAGLDDLTPSIRGELELPDFIGRLVASRTVRPKRIERFWIPLTYAWDVLGATLALWEDPDRARELDLRSEDEESARRRGDLELGRELTISGPVWIGSGARIGDGVELVGPLALGPGCRLGSGARIERSVLFGEARIGERARVSDSVLGRGVSIGEDASLGSRPGSELVVEIKGKPTIPEIPRLGVIAGDGASIGPGVEVAAGTLLPPA